MRHWLVGLTIAVTAVATGHAVLPRAQACAPAPHPGDWVGISDETALIVFDPVTKTEHFVRRATFSTQADDFGFLVPTPTEPELGEVDSALFRQLEQQTAPRYETRVESRLVFGFDSGGHVTVGAAAASPKPDVEVLQQKRVAGLDAAVLRADDPRCLTDWLEKHGYETRPALVEWLRKYTDEGWIITAFKVARDQPAGSTVDGDAVRMSFQTDVPFYPYREPADLREPREKGRAPAPRGLRLYLLSDVRYAGTIGLSKEGKAGGVWPARTVWSKAPQDALIRSVAEAMKVEGGKLIGTPSIRLTEFFDGSSPRPGTDELYFHPDSDTGLVERPPIIRTVVQVTYWPGRRDGLLMAGGIGVLAAGFTWWLWRRAASSL